MLGGRSDFLRQKSAKPEHSTRESATDARTRYSYDSSLMASVLVETIFSLATMTSRRIISTDKDLFDKDERTDTPRVSEKSNITPAVPA